MSASKLELDAQLEIEIIRAKAAIAVAVIENIASGGITSMNDNKIEKVYEIIRKAQATIKE